MHFPTTHWTQLIVLSQGGQRLARESLERVCRDYWRPVFAMVRMRGVLEQDAHDGTLAVMNRAVERARSECVAKGRDWDVFKSFLPGGGAVLGYDQAAEMTGMTMASFKVELHRLRQRLMEMLRAEIARTVSAPHEV